MQAQAQAQAQAQGKNRAKGLAKAVIVAGVGLGLIASGGSLAGWGDAQSIGSEGQKIQSGQLALDAASLGWTFNGDPIAEADLDALRLSPGDSLAYAGEAEVTLEGDSLAAELSLTDAATTGALASNPAVDVAWSVDGLSAPALLTEADSGTKIPVSWQLDLAPVGDPVYVTGKEAQLETLELGDVKVQLTQVAN